MPASNDQERRKEISAELQAIRKEIRDIAFVPAPDMIAALASKKARDDDAVARYRALQTELSGLPVEEVTV